MSFQVVNSDFNSFAVAEADDEADDDSTPHLRV